MNFQQIYLDTVKYWPNEILISDAHLVDSDSGSFPTLSKLWDEVEYKTATLGIWTDLMVWAIFCGLHKLAIDRHQKQELKILTTDVDLEYVKRKFEENFFQDYYQDFWVDYEK